MKHKQTNEPLDSEDLELAFLRRDRDKRKENDELYAWKYVEKAFIWFITLLCGMVITAIIYSVIKK